MRIKIDKESDALYLRLNEDAIVESQEVEPGIILDFDAEGLVVGFEILGLSARSEPGQLRILQVETLT